MNDKEFLQWLYERLRYVHKENINVDYMHKLKAIVRSTDPKKLTPNILMTEPE